MCTWLLLIDFGLLCMDVPPVSAHLADLRFVAVTPERVIVSDDGNGEDVELPCRLRYLPDNADFQSRIDVLWRRIPYGSTQPYNLYLWLETYDGSVAKEYANRYTRPHAKTSDERYHLKITQFTAELEGRYCCELSSRNHPRHESCMDVLYKRFDKLRVTTACHPGSNLTEDIPISAKNPATVSVEFRDIYPSANPPTYTTPRVLELLYIALEHTRVVANSTTFVETSKNRFLIHLNHTWRELGEIQFMARMEYPFGNVDEKRFTCKYISAEPKELDKSKGPEEPNRPAGPEEPEGPEVTELGSLTGNSNSGLEPGYIGLIAAGCLVALTVSTLLINQARKKRIQDYYFSQSEGAGGATSEVTDVVTVTV
jgi:hypothetical protein